LDDAYARHFGPALAAAAADGLAAEESVRGLAGVGALACAAVGAAALVAAALPAAALAAVLALLVLLGVATTVTRLAAALASIWPARRLPPLPETDRLPPISMLIPLFREAGMLRRLLAALETTDYPRALLDVKLVVEADDRATRQALAAIDLPPWVSTVVVPPGRPRTKPRALNYALGFCRGEIVGVLDAEDRPARDQFRRVAASFADGAAQGGVPGARVAAVQCQLTFHNPKDTWISRCFHMEYAIWFSVLLRGWARLGLPVPLGGTSVYFRRTALAAVGGWDAHNVTEDADLGMRLHKRGWRTRLIDSATEEEANCAALPWVRQRSRWLKGYVLTWLSHARAPRRLWQQMGPVGWLGFHVLFLGGIASYLALPLFWLTLLDGALVTLGLGGGFGLWAAVTALTAAAPAEATGQVAGDVSGLAALGAWPATAVGWLARVLGVALAVGQGVMLACAALALARRRALGLIAWLPLLPVYWTLGALAAWKALVELVVAPTWWDKTEHGASPTLRRGG
ncbi:MAG: glycosyltransferase family 2 protein, partial [Pseudomonadota bacterium]